MMQVVKSEERGTTEIGWLHSKHSFSFGDFFDPSHTQFGPLRVLNDDIVEPGQGFGRHFHRDMEIVTYVLKGALEHRDSTGARGVIRASEVQWMSAGYGVEHSEFNHSKTEAVHFLQIWFLPNKKNLRPAHDQRSFTKEDRTNVLLAVASGGEAARSLRINQDVTLYVSALQESHTVTHKIEAQRGAYLYLVEGEAEVDGKALSKGDAAQIAEERSITIRAAQDAEIVLFDVPLRG